MYHAYYHTFNILLQNHYFNDYIIFHHTILSFILPVQNYWAFPVPSHARMLSGAWLFAIWRTVTQQSPLAMEFSRQEHCSGLLFPSPGDLSHPGIEPHHLHLLHWQVGSLPLSYPGRPTEHLHSFSYFVYLMLKNHPVTYLWAYPSIFSLYNT